MSEKGTKKKVSLRKRLLVLMLVILIPVTLLIFSLILVVDNVSNKYDRIVTKITKTNQYNINFKEDMDYVMYMIVANSERSENLVGEKNPHDMIEEARKTFGELLLEATSVDERTGLTRILASLDTLEDRVDEIERDAKISGNYEKNMERLDLNIRVLTDLIQELIQHYIYRETANLEQLRQKIHREVERYIKVCSVIYILILIGVSIVSEKTVKSIVLPIQKLCGLAYKAGQGDFEVACQVEEDELEEMEVLSTSFNKMVQRLGTLVEDIKVEQLNLRATELRLLQEQINPHFLYNTLDNIIWLAEDGDTEQVVKMVSSLSDFFRTSLSKGRDCVTIREEELHIKSYLEIQKFRYSDILEYEIEIDEDIRECEILKLTLQPLVENALYHGIKNKRGLGHIRVSGSLKTDRIVFEVVDDGIGMDENRLEQVRKLIKGEKESEEKGGFGLFNVNQRLQLNYGNEYGIEVNSAYGKGTEFVVCIPYIKK